MTGKFSMKHKQKSPGLKVYITHLTIVSN